MPLVQTRGAASAQGFGEFAQASVPVYIEDVFSTYLYTGNGTALAIVNDIDLSTKGGLTWFKQRNLGREHILQDTIRGAGNSIFSNYQNPESFTGGVQTYNANGFTLNGTASPVNDSGGSYVSWTFRKQPKFFDIVTYTGNGVNNTAISHSLGSNPGCIIFKATTGGSSDWIVYHRSLGQDFAADNIDRLRLNSTAGQAGVNGVVNDVSSTTFTLGNNSASGAPNDSGINYVAYLWAHDAGGFGLTGTDNVISCSSFTTDGSGNATVTLGYEPQWLLTKSSNLVDQWYTLDSMRGWPVTTAATKILAPDSDAVESTGTFGNPTATGFTIANGGATKTYIYIAIRRGPMKVPTSGTSVFSPNSIVGSASVTTNFPVDMTISRYIPNSGQNFVFDRLRGTSDQAGITTAYLFTNNTNQETTAIGSGLGYDDNLGYSQNWIAGSQANIFWNFRRAPSFFDEVCYTGTGSATTVTHNLAAVPELIICKQRNSANSWYVYASPLGASQGVSLNGNFAAFATTGMFSLWNDTAPTSSVFSLGQNTSVNASAATYVAYLFATVAGVSKVGSYTGTGTTLQIDCGFTSGARFVLIRRTSSASSDWYVWDSARGIVAGNDPYLLLNDAAAEVTNTDYIDTYSAGFEISSTAPSAINANGGTFIFLAIA